MSFYAIACLAQKTMWPYPKHTKKGKYITSYYIIFMFWFGAERGRAQFILTERKAYILVIVIVELPKDNALNKLQTVLGYLCWLHLLELQ